MTDAPGHLDLDALADVLAGEREDAHLRSCRPCNDRLAELAAADASVTAALAALPVPPVPDGLSARLAEALEEERRRDAAVVRPLRRRTPGWLPAVAASAVLVMAGAVGWSLLDLSGQDGQEASTAAEAGGTGGGADESGTAAQPEAAAGLAAPAGAVPDWADEAARPAALARLLAAAGPSAGSAAADPPGDGSRLRDPAALAVCLAALPGGGQDVLAVDHARYAGAPALAVARPAAAGLVTVTVVGTGCGPGDPHVLLDTVLPRP